jgi:hypothetical protein
MRTLAGYSFVDKRWKSTDMASRGGDKWSCMEEEVPEVSMSASTQEKRTIRKAVAFRKQPAKADTIGNRTPKITKAANAPRKTAPALDTGNYQVLRAANSITLW